MVYYPKLRYVSQNFPDSLEVPVSNAIGKVTKIYLMFSFNTFPDSF